MKYMPLTYGRETFEERKKHAKYRERKIHNTSLFWPGFMMNQFIMQTIITRLSGFMKMPHQSHIQKEKALQ